MSTEKILRFGRGGAGNVTVVKNPKQASVQKYSNDIEAQDPKSIVDATLDNKAPAAFAHTGRGGAGNVFSPANAPKPGEPEPAEIMSSTDRRPSVLGRGGVGNFEAARPAAKIVGDASHTTVADSEVVRDVNEQVRTPERAFLGEGRQVEHDNI
ncbi:hypothetical protein MMC10_006275 [Thelotrema lepadinum]|nr:hypothetical protein [Thelotrema lepadinum]